MARMPGARWRPLAANWSSQPRMSRYDLVIIHTAVGSFEGTFSWFSNSGGYIGAESHFMTSGAGDIDQYQDTAHQAEANGAANPKAISTENADMGPGFQPWNTRDARAVPAFTPAQVEANAHICAWAHVTHGIPLVLVPDSKPGRRGIAYHRLGTPGYAVEGGELWSSARGKVCPADRRIAQIPQIIARAKQIVGAPAPAPAPAAAPKEATVLQNYPLTGNGKVTLACPVGKASAVLARAWFSAIGPGTVRVYEQTDTAGIRDWTWPLTEAKGLAQRKVTPITDGATRLVVQYDFPDGGTLVLEGLEK